MWTIKYKGGFIHGYNDTELCYVQKGNVIKLTKSLHAAKCYISRN